MNSFLQKSFAHVTAVLALGALASAATITGTITNGTHGKPQAGADVVLLKMGGGMDEVGRTKSDAKGQFTVNFPDDNAPHLVRVIHQNVTYHRQAPPGTTSVEVEVFDAAPKVEGLSTTVHVVQLQATGSTLHVVELYAVKNASKPPRTVMGPQTFEIDLPSGAQVETSLAASPSGLPVNSAPVPSDKQKGRYYFIFPLRPGETRFQVQYHLPYTGEASFAPRALSAMEHLVVRVPKSMQFTPADGAKFQSMDEAGSTTMVATGVKAGETLAFKVSGTGEFPREAQSEAGDTADAGGAGRPGGGLGPPSEAPDPLRQYRWYILGGLGAALVVGAVYVLRRPQPQPAAMPAVPARTAARATPGPGRDGLLLEALKEELFQLEVDRQQGRISPPEYEKAKAALDVTIARALKRNAG